MRVGILHAGFALARKNLLPANSVSLVTKKLFFGPFEGLAGTFLPINRLFLSLHELQLPDLYYHSRLAPHHIFSHLSYQHAQGKECFLFLLPTSCNFHNGF